MICSLYDLANVVPTLAKYYHQASEAYEQACSRHINLVIYIVSHLYILMVQIFGSAIYFILSPLKYFFYSTSKNYSSLLGKLRN